METRMLLSAVAPEPPTWSHSLPPTPLPLFSFTWCLLAKYKECSKEHTRPREWRNRSIKGSPVTEGIHEGKSLRPISYRSFRYFCYYLVGSLRVGQDWATSLSLFTFMHWRRKWQPTPVFLPGESQGWGSLVGCHLWGHTE